MTPWSCAALSPPKAAELQSSNPPARCRRPGPGRSCGILPFCRICLGSRKSLHATWHAVVSNGFSAPASLIFSSPEDYYGLAERILAVWLLIVRRSLASQRRAQANSRPRMARPMGITSVAGPGATSITIPTINMVAPITATTIRRPSLYVIVIACLIMRSLSLRVPCCSRSPVSCLDLPDSLSSPLRQ